MESSAIVVNSIECYRHIKNIGQKGAIIINNYLTRELIDEKSEYLYKNIENKGENNEVSLLSYLTLNWYRDINGKDILWNDNFSIGPILSRRAAVGFSMDWKNYLAISFWLKKYQTIFMPKNISKSIHRVSKNFHGRIKWYEFDESNSYSFDPTPERATYYHFPQVHKLSGLARMFQYLILRYVKKRKVLYINDWTSIELAKKRNDSLIGNSLNPFNGYYYNIKDDYLIDGDKLFPQKIDSKIINEIHIKNILQNANYSIDIELINIFISLLKNDYLKYRKLFIRTYAIYSELLDYYNPEYIINAGPNEFHTVIISQLARKMNIKTLLLLDGYESYNNEITYFNGVDRNSFLFDKIFAQGEACMDFLISCGIPKDQCIISFPTIISKYNNVNRKKMDKTIDVIVMSYLPFQLNIKSLLDYKIKIEIDIIFLLNQMGYKNIGIKLKKGRWDNKELEYYNTLLKNRINDNDLNNIKIIDGQLFESLNSTEFIIGGISTAVLESFYNDIPFYIYEPYENGKTDKMLNSSKIYNVDSVARNISELKDMISKKRQSVNVEKNYVFNGPTFDRISISSFK